MTASMLETRSKGMGGWPRKVYERADIKFHDNSVMKLRVSFERPPSLLFFSPFSLFSSLSIFFSLSIVSSLDLRERVVLFHGRHPWDKFLHD